jgi:hypothetical protein
MRGLLRLYLNRLREGLDDCHAALRLAELSHDLRDACIAHNALGLLGYVAGDLAVAQHHAEAGPAIARRIGATRFEVDHLCIRGVVHCRDGDVAPRDCFTLRRYGLTGLRSPDTGRVVAATRLCPPRSCPTGLSGRLGLGVTRQTFSWTFLRETGT